MARQVVGVAVVAVPVTLTLPLEVQAVVRMRPIIAREVEPVKVRVPVRIQKMLGKQRDLVLAVEAEEVVDGVPPPLDQQLQMQVIVRKNLRHPEHPLQRQHPVIIFSGPVVLHHPPAPQHHHRRRHHHHPLTTYHHTDERERRPKQHKQTNSDCVI